MTAHGSIFSPIWHRVENLRPRLQPQTLIERQVIRGEVWYVAKSRLSNRAHRFSTSVYALLMRLDGRRTVDDIWHQVVELFGEDAPSQAQVVQLLSQLYSLDLIQLDRPVDLAELTERAERMWRRQVVQRYQNPLFFRLPLFDPNRFLNATIHIVRPLLGPAGLIVWLTFVGWFLVQVVLNWEALTLGIADHVLAINNILLILVIFPALKVLHELGHAYATKAAGGEVHEVGLFFLVFMPAPYVDASDSAAFPRKRDRILVAAAGMAVELFVAALAMIVWLSAEPGIVRSLAYNTMLIGSVSTIAFNGNPLLRFDAYYILSDLIGIPNLAARSTQYYSYLTQRHLFGVRSATDPVSAKGEAAWFLAYAPAAFAYRLVVLFGIATFIGTQFFFVGVALAAWTLILAIVWPAMKMMRFLLVAPALEGRRARAILVTAGMVATLATAIFALPIPHGTVASGLVWIPDEARVHAGTNGQVRALLAQPGAQVVAGEALIALDDPYIQAQRNRLEARMKELDHRFMAAEAATPYDMQMLRKQIELARDELAETDRKISDLVVRANAPGLFTVPRPADLIGSYAKKGQLLGYVLTGDTAVVRAVVPETDIDTVRTLTKGVSVRFESATAEPIKRAPIVREVPGASRKLPSAALSQSNGGVFAIDPTAKESDTSLVPFFELDIALPHALTGGNWGARAWVRFDHGRTPIAERAYRNIRQVFLKRFNV